MTQSAVVDTNVISFILKSDTRAGWYKTYLESRHKIASFMSLAELHRWFIKWHWKTLRLKRYEQYLIENYQFYFPNEESCKLWADISETCRKKGKAIDPNDAWIAATALALDLPLVTHNYKHFAHVDGLIVISEMNLNA